MSVDLKRSYSFDSHNYEILLPHKVDSLASLTMRDEHQLSDPWVCTSQIDQLQVTQSDECHLISATRWNQEKNQPAELNSIANP